MIELLVTLAFLSGSVLILVLRRMGRLNAAPRVSARTLTFYVAGCVAFLLATLGLLGAGVSWDFFSRWVGLALFTCFLFGYVVLMSRERLEERTFRLFLASALAVHCAVWAAILVHARHWEFYWFTPGVCELPALAAAANRLRREQTAGARKERG